MLASCSKKVIDNAPQEMIKEVKEARKGQAVSFDNLIGLASPIQLSKAEMEIPLEDYFMDAKMDEVISDVGLSNYADIFTKKLVLNYKEGIPFLSNLKFVQGDEFYDILVKAPTEKKATFILKDDGYQDVKIKGEMNGWNPNESSLKLSKGSWIIDFDLAPGNYQYKFVADGKEINDPINRNKVSNGLGGFNSLFTINLPEENLRVKLSTSEIQDEAIVISYTQKPTKVYAYLGNKLIDTEFGSDETILINVADSLNLKGRDFLRVFSYNDYGPSNDLLIPLDDGKAFMDASKMTRFDKEAQIMYFTLIDRFNNGEASNDQPLDDERLKPLTNYLGGDLKGITKKIKDGYFDSLNINSIWLSPITQNPKHAYQEYIEPKYFYSGYHGYWPISSSRVDHRFGNAVELKELVDVAHKNDINVLLDFVTNHVHELHPLIKNNPDWSTELYLGEGKQNLRLWDEQRLTTWFDLFLPSLDFSKQEVIDTQIDSTLYWIKNFGLDGYRHDATKHIPLEFWRQLTRKLKTDVMVPQQRNIYQIGETYGSRSLINSYISSGMLDAQFDFNLYFDAREAFAKSESSFEDLASSLGETFNYYGHHSSMGYISGNHDQARFASLAAGDLAFGEDHKMAGFERDIQVSDSIGYHRMEMMFAFIMTIPGVPVIFYGDEIGMAGGGDPDCRRMMRFDNLSGLEERTKNTVQKLTDLRRSRMSLIYGDTEIVFASKTELILKRKYFDEETYILFNKSNAPADLEIQSSSDNWRSEFGNQLTSENGTLTVKVAPWEFEILTSIN